MNYKMTKHATHIELNPSQPPAGSVIWLHGLGADGEDFIPIVEELNLPQALPLRFIFPNAPRRAVTINGGYIMPAWFDIYSLQSEHPIDRQGITDSVALVTDYIEKEKTLNISSDKIILAGFSQGAVIALTTGLLLKEKLAGLIGLSGYLPDAEQILTNASPANQQTPIFVGHGSEDVVLPSLLGKRIAAALLQHHYPVTFHEYHMPHSVCIDEINDIRAWMLNVFNVTLT